MRKLFLILCIGLLVFLISYSPLFSWGFYAHKKINYMAVFTLPPDMIGFYKRNIDFISEHAVDPDKRRYLVEGEAVKHYIDIDHYATSIEINPFELIPVGWKDAVNKYSEDTLMEYGILPWNILNVMQHLTHAFKEKMPKKIIQLSAELGHYVADAHVPLHTTENYNGQLTNQHGIHGFWESRLPELMGENYDNLIGRAVYIDKPIEAIWLVIKKSFLEKDSVLLLEADLNKNYETDGKYSFESRGNQLKKVYSKAYAEAYDKKLNGMVERKYREAIAMIGNLWFSAWVDAGRPDLTKLYDKKFLEELEKTAIEEELLWKTGHLKDQKGHTE